MARCSSPSPPRASPPPAPPPSSPWWNMRSCRALLSIEAALAAGSFLMPDHVMRRGDAAAAIAAAPERLSGRLHIGGQDHFYLEGQVSLALPMEDGDVLVHCSTQHPSEVQHGVAHMLGRPSNAVTVEVRRMGGGFGGKETQAAQWAAIAALAAVKTGRPAKFRLERDDDMIMTGKRHDFRDRLRRRLRPRGPHPRHRIHAGRATAAAPPISPAPSPIAPCSMRTTAISSRT